MINTFTQLVTADVWLITFLLFACIFSSHSPFGPLRVLVRPHFARLYSVRAIMCWPLCVALFRNHKPFCKLHPNDNNSIGLQSSLNSPLNAAFQRWNNSSLFSRNICRFDRSDTLSAWASEGTKLSIFPSSAEFIGCRNRNFVSSFDCSNCIAYSQSHILPRFLFLSPSEIKFLTSVAVITIGNPTKEGTRCVNGSRSHVCVSQM